MPKLPARLYDLSRKTHRAASLLGDAAAITSGNARWIAKRLTMKFIGKQLHRITGRLLRGPKP